MAQTQPRILDGLRDRREREQSRDQKRRSVSQQQQRGRTPSAAGAAATSASADVAPPPVLQSKQSPSLHQTSIGNYDYVRTIGEGSFAKVKLAVHRLTDEKVAIKVIDKDSLPDTYSLTHLHREAQIMRMLDHPNIVQLIEVMETKRELHLVLEYASGGEVLDYIVAHQRLKEPEARKFFHEVVSALKYCHERNIVHRDLKAENLLLDSDMHIKISDFGLSNIFDKRKQLTTCCGSPVYSAPELIEGRKYVGPEIDSWSLGVNLYAMVVGDLPFAEKELKKLYERILSGKYQVPDYVSPECRDLISKLLVLNPAKRYTSAQVLEHPWMLSMSQAPSLAWEENENGARVSGTTHSPAYVRPQKLPELDIDILQHMTMLNYDPEVAKQDILGGKFNQAAGTYYLLALKKRREANGKGADGASPPSEDAWQKAHKAAPRPAADDVTSDELALILIKAERTRVTNRMQEEHGGGGGGGAPFKQIRNRKDLISATDELGGSTQHRSLGRPRTHRPSAHQETAATHARGQKEARASQQLSAEIGGGGGAGEEGGHAPPPPQTAYGRGRRHSFSPGFSPGEVHVPPAALLSRNPSNQENLVARGGSSVAHGGGRPTELPTHGRSASTDASSTTGGRVPPLRHIIRSAAAQQPGSGGGGGGGSGSSGGAPTLPPIASEAANHHHASALHSALHSATAGKQPQPPAAAMAAAVSASASASASAAAPATNSYLRSHRPRSNTLPIDESLYMPSPPREGGATSGDAMRALLDDAEPRTIRFAFNCSTTTTLACDVLYTRLIDTLRVAGFTYVAEGFLCLCEAGDIRLEAEICKLPRLVMHGIRFKRISGDMWKYKEICQRIMDGLGL
ncbi:hypothetical protein HDU87_000061 [Geranomyces variabilis]|uniref:non-specific serine/threonine protein kinase n=1 Tax=Geranomyces variabilis TaxID=109894 RepID=A0AAD5XR23_9FUNG|nr:hypothetical protein HDU87_000061 [Geranomyces variabilis]